MDFNGDLTSEQRHQRAGMLFGDEYYRRISEPLTTSDASPYYPLFGAENLRTMEPALYDVFIGSAENRFKEVSLPMRPNPCIEVQTSPFDRPSVPAWFAEVVIIVQHLATKGLLDTFAHQVRLVRGRFGTYEPIDFLALLVGYAISGERTLSDFFERVAPFEAAFMALFGRRRLSHRSSLSRWSLRCGSSLLRSVPYALPEAWFRRWVDIGNHWRTVGPTRSSLHRL